MKKALVVDDSNFFLKLMTDILSALDFAVSTFYDGTSACQTIESTKFDIIFTDLNMPGMDGIDFVNKVRQMPNGKTAPVVMVSSEKDDERIRKAKKAGVTTFVPKPVDQNRVMKVLDQVFKKDDPGAFPHAVSQNARFFRQGDKEIFVLNFATDSQKEIMQLIESTAQQIRQRPRKSVRALTLVQKGMFSNEILMALKELSRDNEPYVSRSAVVGANGVYKVAMDAIAVFSKRKFKICNSKQEALHYLLQN